MLEILIDRGRWLVGAGLVGVVLNRLPELVTAVRWW
jgi:hypothetical protein